MRKLITICALFIVFSAAAQTKHLPPQVKLTFTDAQVIAMDKEIDSMRTLLLNSNIMSGIVQYRITRLGIAFQPMYQQIGEQMIADTTKAVKTPKKP